MAEPDRSGSADVGAQWRPPASDRGPRRRDLTKPQKGSPSTCGAGAVHILALQPDHMARSARHATQHDDLIVSAYHPFLPYHG